MGETQGPWRGLAPFQLSWPWVGTGSAGGPPAANHNTPAGASPAPPAFALPAWTTRITATARAILDAHAAHTFPQTFPPLSGFRAPPSPCYKDNVMSSAPQLPPDLPAAPASEVLPQAKSPLARWLTRTLNPRDADAFRLAYRLDGPLPRSVPLPATQSEVGKQMGISRERARQRLFRASRLLREAFAAPAPPLARFIDAARAYLVQCGGTLLRDEPLAPPPATPVPADFATSSPFAVLRFLADFLPDVFVLHRDFVTLAPVPLVEASETYLLERLRTAHALLPLSELVADAPLPLRDALPPLRLANLLSALALSIPGLVLTRDDRVATAEAGVPELLCELLSSRPDATIPDLLQAYNLLVRPPSQLGTGHLRAHLLACPLITRSSPNHYRLAAPLQPSLPPLQYPT